MLKVTFAHIGNSYIPFRTLLMETGLEPVIPPPITQRTIALGTKLAPEFACFPMKVNLGNYLEAIQAGAEGIFMAGGVGPCRFGYYGELQREILREAGFNVEFLVLEPPKTHPAELWDKIRRFFPKHRVPDIMRAIHHAWLKAEALDRFDRLANQIRPLEKQPGATDRLQEKFYRELDETWLIQDLKKVRTRALMELRSISVKQGETPPKIVLVGEIYLVLEPRINFQMEKLLGEMGVEVERTIYFTKWVLEHLVLSIIYPAWHKKLALLAKPYLRNFVGGHGIETIAYTVKAGINRYHGVVEVAPFTCMPEIVAMQILPDVSRELDIPVLTVIIDEHSAEAGIRTRIEAFVDLLKHNRKSPVEGNRFEVISRH